MSRAEDPERPDWLDRGVIEKVIKHHTKDGEAKVEAFAIQSGSKPGENFASDLFRASINYATGCEARSMLVIVKVMPSRSDGDLDGRRLFMTEMKMYGDTLIDINRVLLDAHEDIKLFPR